MKSLSNIFALIALFLGVVFLLDKIGFWGIAGIEQPHGLIFQGALFFALYALLKTFLFDPYLNVLDERELQTTGKLKLVEDSQERSRVLFAQYREAIDKARLQAIRDRERLALEMEALEKEKLSKAKMESLAFLVSKTKENQINANAVKSQLSGEVLTWVEDIVQKVSLGTTNSTSFKRVSAVGS